MMRVLLGLLVAALLLPGGLEATVLVPADLAEMTVASRAIVHGRVVDVRAQWSDGRRNIDTYVTVAVSQYLKADWGPTVVVRVPGGEVGAFREILVGAPAFEEGDEVVLFLGAQGPSVPYVLGLSQGVYRVSSGSEGKVVTPSPLVGTERSAGPVVRGDPARRPEPLERFAERIKEILAAGRPPVAARGRR